MSYRTKVNDIQIFGNNESYLKWNEYLISQGVEIDEDGSYDGEISDFMGALSVIEDIVMDLERERLEKIKEKEKLENRLRKNGVSEEDIKNLVRSYIFNALSIFDLRDISERLRKDTSDDYKYRNSLLDELFLIIRSGYMFIPLVFYYACKDDLESTDIFSVDGHFYCYKLREGCSIKVSAG